MVGKSENDRPVAPGPPLNKVSPENRTPASGTYRQHDPGEWPGVQMTGAAVERESPLGDDALDAQRCTHSTTTDRSTSPACMVWKASSTSSILIRSVTNFSSGSLP